MRTEEKRDSVITMPVETMNIHTDITPDFISRAVDEVRKLKPDYGLLLGLYEKIFIEQEKVKESIRLPDYTIPQDKLMLKTKEMFPLVSIFEFRIDSGSAEYLLSRICEILERAGNGISESVKRITDAVSGKSLEAGEIVAAFLREDESFFSSCERDFAIDRKVLSFVAYSSLKPSLVKFSGMISRYLATENEWEKGYCPVCGSMPELSILEENGKRSFLCGFCGHQWQSKRVYCPFCENTDHDTLRYYEIEDEEEYRVDVCDKCHRYIKTVDMRKLSRPVYLPLESISTPYIDVRFREMGYSPGNTAADR